MGENVGGQFLKEKNGEQFLNIGETIKESAWANVAMCLGTVECWPQFLQLILV